MEQLKTSGELSSVEKEDLIDAGMKDVVDKILTRKDRKKARNKGVRTSPKKGHSKKAGKDRSMNREHLVPKIRGGSNHENNIKMSKITAHAGKHSYLGVQLPHEQLKTILEDNFQVLHKETREMIKEEIESILEYYIKWDELYDKKCFRGNNHPKQ